MTTPVSAPAATTRENARQSDGKFGTQPLSEADLELEPAPVAGPGQVLVLAPYSQATEPIVAAAAAHALGPVRVDAQDQGTTTRISYRDPVAGMVEVFHAPGFEAYPTIIDEHGRNLRGTQAAAVLAPEHLSPAEQEVAAAKLTEADKKLIALAERSNPGELSVVEHSVRTLRAAGVGAEIDGAVIIDPMRPTFMLAADTPWATRISFAGSDAVEIESTSPVRPSIGAPAGSVPAPSSVRFHLAEAAKQSSYSARMGPEMRKLVNRGSIERTDADGRYERAGQPGTWTDAEDVTTTFRIHGNASEDERLELAMGKDRYELRVAPNWAAGVPAEARRKMADARITAAGVNPDKLCRAMVQGQQAWAAFREHDPYGLKDS